MKCIYCNKKLRPCKRIDFPNRNFHFKCKELERKLEEEYQIYLFVEWLKERIKLLEKVSQKGD
jgi:hypothetical protein